MIYKHFVVLMMLRICLLTASLLALVIAWQSPGLYAVKFLLLLLSVLAFIAVYRYAIKTNIELNRFLESIRYGDYSQRFDGVYTGVGFDELTNSFNDIVDKFKHTRQNQEEKLRHLKALTEHIPVPLLSLYSDGRIQLHNNAARRLFSESFGDLAGGGEITRIDDIKNVNQNLADTLTSIAPGERRLVQFICQGMERQFSVVATLVATESISEKLLSLQDIQSELDEAQSQAWRDLVRVLTHEMMNSITPIASLATTASDLVGDTTEKLHKNVNGDELEGDLENVRSAVDTVARRSEGLMQFVQGYRSLAQAPEPKRKEIFLSDSFNGIKNLFAKQWAEQGIELSTYLYSEKCSLYADPDLLEQVLINLLKNAEQALCADNISKKQKHVSLSAKLSQHGRVVIEISDSGPGIASAKMAEIFLPFYTTKREGAGVGLALARQIMIAHGGNIVAGTSPMGGARFGLIF